MDLTPEHRERIYLEEKARRGKRGSSTLEIALVAAAAAVAFAGFLMLIQKPGRSVKLEDLRKAYDGLSPEEEE